MGGTKRQARFRRSLVGWAVTAAAGGVWGALLARLLAEWGPLLPLAGGCWLYRPLVMLGLALCGAVAASLGLGTVGRRAPGAPGRVQPACVWPLALGGIYLLQPAVRPLWGAALWVAGAGGAAWLCRSRRDPAGLAPSPGEESAEPGAGDWAWGGLAFVVPLALYVATLAPSVLPGDSAEFQFTAPILGIPHPTGYPLYLLLGKLFSWLPTGSVAYRLNLLSAVAAAGAVWAAYRAGRALGLGRPASSVGAALLAVSETFWSRATIAEKYALHAFFVTLTLWLGLQWRRQRLAGRSHRPWLYAWALGYGLSLAHHRTMGLLAPAYLWLVWSTDRRILRPREAWRPLLLALAPLALYALLPLFSALNPPYAYIRVDSVRAFLDLVLARTYQSGVFRGGWAALPGRVAEFAALIVRQFGPVGLGLAVGGLGVLFWRDRRAAWALLGGMLAQILFALNYYVPNTYVYYLPAYAWLAVCAGAAVQAMLAAAARLGGRWGRPVVAHATLALLLAAAALPMQLCAARWTGMDQRRAYERLSFDHAYGEMALRAVEPGALLVGDWGPATVLWYVQLVDGLAPTAQVAALDSLEVQWADPVEEAVLAGRAVYLARPLIAAGERYALSSAGPLVEVLPAPRLSAPAMSLPRPVDLEGGMRLLGGDLAVGAPGAEGSIEPWGGAAIAGGSTLHLTLYWQAAGAPAGDYAVTVRWVDAEGHVWLEHQNRHPVGGTYPTSRWQPGEVVADYYALPLPPDLHSGTYRLEASMGVPFAERGLRDREGMDRWTVATIALVKPPRWPYAALDNPVRAFMGEGRVLTSYEMPRQVLPGESVSLALQWLACGPPGPSPDAPGTRPGVPVVLVGRDGAVRVLEPLPGAAEDWQAGALVVKRYVFVASEDLAAVEVRAENRRPFYLPIQVRAAPPPLADFGGVIRLRSASYEADTLVAGDTVRLTLEWEAVRAIDEAYKVFVHVLGPNGLPVAQQDNEPLNGTYPTTRWSAGERVRDSYAFALPADLAPGEYRVEVGLYRISDLSRLPVLDERQAVVDDKVFLDPLTVVAP